MAVADIHGAADAFVAILQRAKLIDGSRRWIGGNAILVQTGDTTDRGPGVRAVLDLLMALEGQAKSAGGRVEALLGNHELMNLVGNTRYVTPEIAAAWADGRSQSRRERGYEEARRLTVVPPDKDAWMAAHPPGYIEYREAFGPGGRYGRWLRSKNAIVQIDGTVFMHAGIDPAAMAPIDQLNARIRADIRAWDEGAEWLRAHRIALPFSTMPEVMAGAQAVIKHIEERRAGRRSDAEDERTLVTVSPLLTITQSSLFAGEGPMWFRGYARWNDAEGGPLMAAVLKHYGVRRFVTGHTPQAEGRIRSRFEGGAWLIDTGMLGGTYFPGGRPSALEIAGDTVTPIYLDETASSGLTALSAR